MKAGWILIFLLLASIALAQGELDSFLALQQARADILEMQSLHINIAYPEDLFSQAQEAHYGKNITKLRMMIQVLNESNQTQAANELSAIMSRTDESRPVGSNYSLALALTDQIRIYKEKAIEAHIDYTDLAQRVSQTPAEEKTLADTEELLSEINGLVNSGQLERAAQKIQKANEKLDNARVEHARTQVLERAYQSTVLYWVKSRWQEIIVFFVVAGGAGGILIHRSGKWHAQHRLRSLQNEKKALQNLIKQDQQAHYEQRSISTPAYKERKAMYQTRLAEIDQEIANFQKRLKA